MTGGIGDPGCGRFLDSEQGGAAFRVRPKRKRVSPCEEVSLRRSRLRSSRWARVLGDECAGPARKFKGLVHAQHTGAPFDQGYRCTLSGIERYAPLAVDR